MKTNSTYFNSETKKFIRNYNFISFMILIGKWGRYDFFNLGYKGSLKKDIILDDIDKKNQLHISLYLKVMEELPESSKSILEIGSGIGGGCYLLKKYFKIPEVVGIDYSKFNVIYSKKKFEKQGVHFLQLSAENADKLNKKFDVIISVEASQHFSNWELFFKNVYSLLNDNGFFFYAAIFTQKDIITTEKLIQHSNLKIHLREDISDGVINSLNLLTQTNEDTKFVKTLKRILLLDKLEKYNAYNPDSDMHKKIISKELIYVRYVITKNAG